MTRTAYRIVACPYCGAEHAEHVLQSFNTSLGLPVEAQDTQRKCRCGKVFKLAAARLVCWASNWKDEGRPGQLSSIPEIGIPAFLLKSEVRSKD